MLHKINIYDFGSFHTVSLNMHTKVSIWSHSFPLSFEFMVDNVS